MEGITIALIIMGGIIYMFERVIRYLDKPITISVEEAEDIEKENEIVKDPKGFTQSIYDDLISEGDNDE